MGKVMIELTDAQEEYIKSLIGDYGRSGDRSRLFADEVEASRAPDRAQLH